MALPVDPPREKRAALVPNPTIVEAELLKPRPWLLKPHVWPFILLYPAFFYVYTQHYDEYIQGKEWTTVYLGILVSLQALLWLMPFWNINIRARFRAQPVNSVDEAEMIKILPAPNCGVGDICPIMRDEFDDGEIQVSFLYQKRRFLYDESTNTFAPPAFFIDSSPAIGDLHASRGLPEDTEKLSRRYGANRFDIPVPSFSELFQEHAVAPFFVFQVFCVGLWLLDEYWYYSIFTLFMLVMFECTVVFQRRSTLLEFRSMGVKPYDISVFRGNSWREIRTDSLLPGDLVSVVRSTEESVLPCDLVLLDGSAIVNEAMLSGESTPLLKESILLRPAAEKFTPESADRNSVLHGGTKVLQVSPPQAPQVPAPPDGGALALVTKTGFETTQGSLVRVMIFSTERVGVGNKEAMFFILFLLQFAIAASWYVWREGVRIDRERSKLLLDCVIIITSVVPPELPMELTIAVNNSLAALAKFYIYCTEPFRIPYAGRVDVCCFDKTGTLTGEDLVFEGLGGLKSDSDELVGVPDAPENTILTLAAAHALVRLEDGDVVGDPLEKTTLTAIGWQVKENDVVASADGKKHLKILRRFQFSSALKRSSSLASVQGKTLVAVKGAPETIKQMLAKAPEHYDQTYKTFTRSGSRVLALGYRYLSAPLSEKKLAKAERGEFESDLQFAGFLVFHCPLKEDAVESVKMLSESSHRCVMITGDNPLTACHVAQQVGITERPVLILDAPDGAELAWRSVDESVVLPVSPGQPLDQSLFAEHDICVSGAALTALESHEDFLPLVRHTWVWARVSPKQKELILTALKQLGYMTLMCGDGTNDVGALKQADVGVALLNGTSEGMAKLAEKARNDRLIKAYEKQKELMKRWNPKASVPVPKPIAHLYPPGRDNPHYLTVMKERGVELDPETVAKLKREMEAEAAAVAAAGGPAPGAESKSAALADKLSGMLDEEDGEPPQLKLGDASVAAPFTSKLANVAAVTHIIRQGRCALVATIQMYKILALNCLISAYSLSVLYLAGIKYGDTQQTVSGVLLSVCFLSISRSKSIEKLSAQRPQPGIFNIYIMGSIMGQFAVHIASFIYVAREVYKIEPASEGVDLDGDFEPSLLCTAIFLLQLSLNVSTFVCNYQGRPFRQGLTENKGMYYGLLGVAALSLAGATEFMPELNEAMQFVPMEPLFKVKLTTTMILDFSISYLIEIGLKHFFADFKPADIAERTVEAKKEK